MLGGMTLTWKIVIDCADPHAQAAFWAAALGYVVEDNRVLIERLLSAGVIPQEMVVTMDDRPAFRTLQAVRHPDDPVQEGTGIGLGRRLLFQQVPEPSRPRAPAPRAPRLSSPLTPPTPHHCGDFGLGG
jgi:hypothetical protein